MAPPKTFRAIKPVHFNAEFDRFKEFEEICSQERKTVTQKFNEFIIQTIERNSIAENDMPKENISCLGYTPKPVQQKINGIQQQEQQQLQQSDLRMWLPRTQAFKMARKVPMDAQQWIHLGETCRIIAEKIRTGYL